MQHHIQSIVNHIFKKDSLQEVTVQELQQFADDYPYVAVGQLLFAQKLEETKAQNSSGQSAKTALYFQDPVWLQWLLTGTGQKESIEESIARARKARENRIMGDTVKQVSRAPAADENKPQTAAVASVENSTPAVTTERPETPVVPVPAATTTMETAAISTGATDTAAPAETDNNTEHSRQEAPPAETPAPEVTATSGPTAPPAVDDNEEAIFEPYHTIDYFASQGIKLKLEDLTSDKLGKQLKSFTEWLRSMKRIAPTIDNNTLDELSRDSIQRIADHSNEASDILTETMAQVWARQGHPLKAIAIYEKLSLLNPAKSAYFASRIEELKAQ